MTGPRETRNKKEKYVVYIGYVCSQMLKVSPRSFGANPIFNNIVSGN